MRKLFIYTIVFYFLYACSGNITLDTPDDKDSNKIADTLDAKLLSLPDSKHRVLVMYSDKSVKVFDDLDADEIKEKASRNDILFIEPDYTVKADIIYSTRQAGAYDVWVDSSLGYKGAGINSDTDDISVAVLDTGVDTTHQDFGGGKIIDQADCHSLTSTSCVSSQIDDNGHGTHVAGIVAGTGTAWDSANSLVSLELTGNFVPPAGSSYSGIITYFPMKVISTSVKDLTYYLTWNSTGGEAGIQVKEIEDLNTSNTLGTDQQSKTGSLGTDCSSSECITKTFSSILDPDNQVYKGFLAIPYAVSDMSSEFYLRLDIPVEKWSTEASPTQGMAPSAKLVAVKVLNSSGSGNVSDIINGLNYVKGKLSTYHIVVANLSLSLTDGTSSTILNTTIDDLIDSGLTIVASAGNSQGASYVGSPGVVSRVITVGAVNSNNEFTNYSSVGNPSSDTIKPDILAPGGSVETGLGILSARTKASGLSEWNTDNGVSYDSYTLKTGTSQAAPHVAGAVALLADAIDTWSYTDDTYPRLVKMLLCMTATEVAKSETDAIDVGTPERSAVLKDRVEGYGLMDVYGALSALTTWDYDTASFTYTFSSQTYGRRSVARKIHLDSGYEYNFSLDMPTGADFDLYLFDSKPDENGEPILLASSTFAVSDTEKIIDFIPPSTGDYYIVVKKVSSSGTFSLSLENKRTKPSTPTEISDLLIRQDINNKVIYVSWNTNVKALSKVQYGTTAGLGKDDENSTYKTYHTFEISLDANPVYLRVLSNSVGTTESEISTAVSKTYKVEYTTVDHNISVSELFVNETENKIAGCATVKNISSNSKYSLIFLLPILFLTFLVLCVSKKVRQ